MHLSVRFISGLKSYSCYPTQAHDRIAINQLIYNFVLFCLCQPAHAQDHFVPVNQLMHKIVVLPYQPAHAQDRIPVNRLMHKIIVSLSTGSCAMYVIVYILQPSFHDV